jgi:hypothetical protein
MDLNDHTRDQIEGAYRAMAREASYYPAAPSDGHGTIAEEVNVDREAREYAERWWNEENTGDYVVGSCSSSTRPATIYAIEAARLMCAGTPGDVFALRLLRMAVEELERLA